jgi:two-component system OmpR family response regulator
MRLLLVEDDQPLATGLVEALRHGGYSVDWMDNGLDGETALLTQNFDAVVLDLNLPGRDGFEVLRRLRARGSAVPVLILSARDDTVDRVRGLDLGADDYLVKPFELSELEARLRALIRRGQGISSNLVAIGRLNLDIAARRASIGGDQLDLTAREFATLQVLVMRAGQVVSKSQLADSLCDWDQVMTPNAIDIQIHRLRKKLETADVSIRTLRGFGYLLEAGSDH